MKRTLLMLILAGLAVLSTTAAFAEEGTVKIVFVCTGNTCRSPIAEGIAKSIAEQKGYNMEIVSRGTKIDPEEVVANPYSVIVMSLRGIDIKDHKSQIISKEDIETASLILTMTAGHKKNVQKLFPAAAPYTFTLTEYATGRQGDIRDPWGLTILDYESTAKQLELLVTMVLEKIAMAK